MKTGELTQRIKKIGVSKGCDLVGVASVERFRKAPKGHHPQDILPGCLSVISLGRRLITGIIEAVGPGGQLTSYKHHLFSHINASNTHTAYEISRFLEEKGHVSFPVQPTTPYDPEKFFGVFSHRHAAVLAGLGVFGRNNLVLTRQFGPRNRFITVLTTARLDEDPLLEGDLCTNCGLCRKNCPAQAWDAKSGKFYKAVCAHYGQWDRKTQECEKACGNCIKVCPVGKVTKNDLRRSDNKIATQSKAF